jgi:hypothetical protein
VSDDTKLTKPELIELLAFAWECFEQLVENADALREFSEHFAQHNPSPDAEAVLRSLRQAKQAAGDALYHFRAALRLHAFEERIQRKHEQSLSQRSTIKEPKS